MTTADEYSALGDVVRADQWARDYVRSALADRILDISGTADSYAAVGLALDAARLRAAVVYLGRLIPMVDVAPALAFGSAEPPVISPYDRRPVTPQVGVELT